MSSPRTRSNPLPANPCLEFYRKAARELLKAAKAGSLEAVSRLDESRRPEAGPASRVNAQRATKTPQLSDAQLAIAREHGFASWPKFKAHLDSLAATAWSRPYKRDLDWYNDRAGGLVTIQQDGPADVLDQIRQFHPRFAQSPDEAIKAADFSVEDARLVVAREHGFPDWDSFAHHIGDLESGRASDAFLTAFEALEAGDVSAFEAALIQDPSIVHARGSNGNSLLGLAASVGPTEAVRLLLDRGADVNQGNRYGWTLLHQAGYSNNVELAKIALEAGARADLSGRGDGGTPLMAALFWGHVEVADFLAGTGIFPNNLRAAAGLGLVDRIEAFFRPDGSLKPEAGAHREFYRPHGGFPQWTPSDDPQEILNEAFVYACKSGRIAAMDVLLQKGAQIDGDPYRGTGLTWAAVKERHKAVAWLLEHGAHINQQATFGGSSHGQGVTALHLSAQNGALEMIQFLVERGADPNIRDHLYHSPAWGWALNFEHNEAVRYLLECAAPHDIHAAVQLNDPEILDALLANDPSLAHQRNPPGDGETPLHRAARCGHTAAATRLLSAGADPNAVDREGKTPLERAMEQHHVEVAERLQGT